MSDLSKKSANSTKKRLPKTKANSQLELRKKIRCNPEAIDNNGTVVCDAVNNSNLGGTSSNGNGGNTVGTNANNNPANSNNNNGNNINPFEIKVETFYSIDFCSMLGEGTSGKVFKCINKSTNILYAVKVFPKVFLNLAKKEESFLKQFQGHPNIIQYHNLIDGSYTNGNTTLCGVFLFMEYASLGNISCYRFTEQQLKHISKQICIGLNHIHSCGVIHRDLKPQNILCTSYVNDEYTVKIGDFGNSFRGIISKVVATTDG